MKEKFLDVLKTKNKRRYLNDSKNKTIDVEQIIINMSDDEELFDFIRKNEVEFFNSYYKLIDYIESYVKAESVGGSYHSLVKDENLDKGFEKMISNLRELGRGAKQKQAYSTWNKIEYDRTRNKSTFKLCKYGKTMS